MYEIKVITSCNSGTIIDLDANYALNFLMGLSITVINTVRDAIEEKNERGDTVIKSCDHDVMHMIEYYNSCGSPGTIYSNILQTNATILLNFVQDIVLNDTTRGLYLFYHGTNRNTKAAPYHLIVKALEDVHRYYMVYGNDTYTKHKQNYFNRYNENFLDLIKRTPCRIHCTM